MHLVLATWVLLGSLAAQAQPAGPASGRIQDIMVANKALGRGVTDYWLVDGQLHFRNIEEGGAKLAEHMTDFNALDLQTTVDVNTQRGFRFVLRNEPAEDYLRDHPEIGVTGVPPPETLPAATPPPRVPEQ